MMRHNRIRTHKVLVLMLAYLKGEEWAINFLDGLLAVTTGTGLKGLDALEVPREFAVNLYGHRVATYLTDYDEVLVEVEDGRNRVYAIASEFGNSAYRIGHPRVSPWLADALAHVAILVREYPGAGLLWKVVARCREV